MGYESPMPVQEEVIPFLLGDDNDVIALAQTGTGKTAAFGLPILQKIDVTTYHPQALVLCPTRELCLQIADDLNDYSKYIDNLKVLPVYGGSSIESQIKTLKRGVHVVVATPGRLLDLMNRKTVDLSLVKNVIMDEADEMLNMGFTDSINAILAEVPENRNMLLFSATMPKEIANITKKYMKNPKEIVIGNKNEGNKNIRDIYYMVQARDKYLALKRIADFYPNIYGIVFCRTRKETQEIADKAWERIQEVEKLGGMAKAIETGIPKMRIEEAAARKQARIDSGIEKIIGVNEYRLDHEAPIDILAVDNTAVRESQIKRLKELRANRDEAAVKKALEAITECVKTGKGNLLELAIEAAKVRASLGEISDACEVVVGRYKAVIRSISGVYSSEVKSDPAFEHAKELVAKFAKKEGRQPRIMIAKLGQDGHDRGAKVVATGYADIGFDVDMGPLFQTPEEAAKQAVENDVHVVGVSSLAAGHLTLVPQIIAELKKLGREDIIVIVGGVIPAQDYDELYRDGAAAIFGPGTPIATAAIKILEILLAD